MSTPSEPSDPLAALDFTPGPLDCEVVSQPWTHYQTFFGGKIHTPFPKVPKRGKCPHPATHLVHWRVCLCLGNAHTWREEHPELAETHSPLIYWGLCVVATSMCDSHIEYFIEYLTYPFACPKCGIAYGSAEEMLVGGDELNELHGLSEG